MDGLISLSGFLVGILVGMTGVGGGALMTPLLILGFQVPPMVAVGTDLLFAAITKSVGGFSHAQQKSVDWRIVGLLAAGSIPTTLVTLVFLSELQPGESQDELIRKTVALALLFTAIFMLFRQQITRFLINHCPNQIKAYKTPLTILSGCIIGYLVTLSSIGAGAIGIVFISILYPRLNGVKIVGSDIVHAVPLTTLAGLGHLALGSIDFYLLMLLLIGSLPGIYIGSRLGHYFPDQTLRKFLALVLFFVGLNLLSST